MEALTTALTLEPGSVAEHPAYRILYNNNRLALLGFITHARSLTYEEAGNNLEFCKAILDDEKGDDVSYAVINANLTKLRLTSSTTYEMPSILEALDKLIKIRDQWLQAGIRYFSFDCWYSMARGYFIKNNDPELLALLKDAPEQALENFFSFRSEFSNPMSQMGYKSDLNQLRSAYIQRHRDLISYKRQMQRELGSFRSIHAKIDDHLKKLSNHREAEKQRQEDKLVRRKQLKERTLNNAIYQMGQLGSEPLAEDVQNALDVMHEALFEEHFDIIADKDEEGSEAKKKQEEWQKEVLSRPHNLNDHDRKRTYVIRFGAGAADKVKQCTESRCRVPEEVVRVPVLPRQNQVLGQRTGDAVVGNQIDAETLGPASILDRKALQWMASNYGQRKVKGVCDLLKSFFMDSGRPWRKLQKGSKQSDGEMVKDG